MLTKIILGNSQIEKRDCFCFSFQTNVPETSPGQNNLPHTVKIMVYIIHIMFGHLFDNSIKMINWLLDHNLRELGKLEVSSYLQSDCKISQEWIAILDSYRIRNSMDVGGEILLWILFTQHTHNIETMSIQLWIFSVLGKEFSRHFQILSFFIFSQKICFGVLYKLSP